jgi:hypothetical protein
MISLGHRRTTLRASLTLLALLGGLLLLIGLGSDAAAAKGKAKVDARIVTKSQKQLLEHGKLAVAVKTRHERKVKLVAAHRGRRSLFAPKVLKSRTGRIDRTVKLDLTDAGAKRLGSCGAKKVKVRGLYRVRGKKRKAVDLRNLKKDASRCEKPYTPVPVENADRCDFLDPPRRPASG